MFSEEQLKREDVSIDTLKKWLPFRLGGYKIAVKSIKANSLLYRGVRCQQRPDNISRISYPKPEHVTTLQRVNRERQPRFYCSCASPAVFYELHAKAGDLIALSVWELKEPLWIHGIGYHPKALQRIGTQKQNIAMRRAITHAIPNETKENSKLRRQISEAFTADVPDGKEYRYKQSIAINESLSEEVDFEMPVGDPDAPKHKKISGTAYPSVRMRGDADNIVLLPEFVNSSLILKSVQYVRVEAADENNSAFTFLTIGIANNFSGDNIEWLDTLGAEDDRRCSIAFENGHWIGRDGRGGVALVR